MANRHNHYEAAFEAYLQSQQVAYVAVNEQRRSRIAGGSLKNVDYLVSPADGATFLIDVKGRRFPSGNRSKQYWKNWSTLDDLRSLARWQEALGSGAVAMFLFAYHIVSDHAPTPSDMLFQYRRRQYAFLAVRVADYIQKSKPLSQKWQTVTMSAERFREAAVPFSDLIGPGERTSFGC